MSYGRAWQTMGTHYCRTSPSVVCAYLSLSIIAESSFTTLGCFDESPARMRVRLNGSHTLRPTASCCTEPVAIVNDTSKPKRGTPCSTCIVDQI